MNQWLFNLLMHKYFTRPQLAYRNNNDNDNDNDNDDCEL